MITSVTEQWKGRQGSLSLKKFARKHTRLFLVTTDSTFDDDVAVIDGLSDTIGDTHPNDVGAIVEEISVTQDDASGRIWRATVTYNSDTEDPAKNPEDPLDKPVVKGLDTAKFQKTLEQDLDGDPVVNSADCPFLNGIMIDESRATITIEKNYSTNTFTDLAELFDVINENDWNSFPKETLKVGGISLKEMFESDTAYNKVIYTLEYNKQGWQPRAIDQGRYEKIPATSGGGSKITLIKDAGGQALPEPSLLNGAGRVTTEPNYLDFKGYVTNDFADIPW